MAQTRRKACGADGDALLKGAVDDVVGRFRDGEIRADGFDICLAENDAIEADAARPTGIVLVAGSEGPFPM
jgi:hypothetical protein